MINYYAVIDTDTNPHVVAVLNDREIAIKYVELLISFHKPGGPSDDSWSTLTRGAVKIDRCYWYMVVPVEVGGHEKLQDLQRQYAEYRACMDEVQYSGERAKKIISAAALPPGSS